MRIKTLLTALLLMTISSINAQPIAAFADSIRKAYNIPELGIAVITADSVTEMQHLGYTKINTGRAASATDRFRIGSNTKTVTAFIAALLVKQGKIAWNTKFFTLYPELKAQSKPGYYNMTLQDLLSFRSRLNKYTYTDALPVKEQFHGSEGEQRYQFIQWALSQQPVAANAVYSFSNPGYTAAGLMLEKAAGKSYNQLVTELGAQLGIDFHFGAPNSTDTLQPWGHDANLAPEPPGESYKLEWLLPAGNISVSLPGYAKFIQLQLRGLQGRSDLLTKEEFTFLHYGLPTFALGWFWATDELGHKRSWHTGNPGTFLSQVYIDAYAGKAYILFTNVQSAEAEEGLGIIYQELKRRQQQ